MEKTIYKIDENGFLLFDYDKQIDENEELPKGFTDIPLPTNENGQQLPFYKPQLVNRVWVETLTQAEIDAKNNVSKEPTLTEIQEVRISDLEMAIAEMLGGVI